MVAIFSLKQIKRHYHWILHIRISLCIKFHFEQTILNIWTKFAQEWYLWPKAKIQHHWTSLIQISLGTKFQLKLTILIFFWLDLPRKGFSGLKQEKLTPYIFYIILHIQISLVRNFSSNWQLFFGSNLHKMVFPVKNWKSQHHHWILHIQISLLVPNFCFNWQFWFFWPDLSKKGFYGLKHKKWTPHIFYIIMNIQISLVRNFS